MHSSHAWTLANIYGPCTGEEHLNFVSWLYDVQIGASEDWILMGDFKFIRSPANRNRPGGDLADMITFNDIIRSQSLVEIRLRGATFTWSNMQTDPLLEQLDWFFTSANWTSSYPNTTVAPLPNPVSDHVPCVISIETSVPKSKIFRFENFWISHPGFFEVVQSTWNKNCFAHNPAAVLSKKFKHLRYALKKWSKNISRLNLCIDNSNWALLELDGIEDLRPLTIPEKNFRVILKEHLVVLLGYKREYWRKRYTVRWF